MTQRSISDDFRESIQQQESEVFPLIFVRIRHPAFSHELRFVKNGADIKLNSADSTQQTYIGAEFDINVISDGENTPTAQFSAQNVDRILGQALLDTSDPARIDIEIYSSALFDETVIPHVPIDPDPQFEYQSLYLWLTDVSIMGDFVSGTLKGWDYTQENYPSLSATEEVCPGLFW